MNFLGITSVRWFLFLQRERGDSNAEALRAETRLPADSKGKLTADLRENVITQRSDILTFTFSSLGKGHADPRHLINSQNPPSWSLLLLSAILSASCLQFNIWHASPVQTRQPLIHQQQRRVNRPQRRRRPSGGAPHQHAHLLSRRRRKGHGSTRRSRCRCCLIMRRRTTSQYQTLAAARRFKIALASTLTFDLTSNVGFRSGDTCSK